MTTLPAKASIVVIGAGIQGLSAAYELAQLGVKDIVVVERSYLCSGASGRNGGGVRAQWSSETNIQLMKESIKLCRDFATEMRINVWFRQGGYLFIATSDARAQQLATSVDLQRKHELPTRMISPADAREIVPQLSVEGVVGASYNPDDGVVFPWPFVWGYARACEKAGVSIHTFTDVVDLKTDGRAITAVVTNHGTIETPLVLVAAGAWSPEIARMVGVELPNHPHRHEICSTEPLKPFLKPLVADLETGLYFSQSMRGEIVGGISNPNVPDGIDQNSSLEFLGLYAGALTTRMPVLGAVRVLRQWAGCYDITPDGSPVIGRVDGLEGLVLACGFMGHGFMIAPVIAKLLARHIVEDGEKELFERWNLRRFAEGRLLTETMILG